MPCNSMTKQSLSIGLENAVVPVLRAALSEVGMTITLFSEQRIVARDGGDVVEWIKGKGMTVTASNAEKLGGYVRQAYSKAAVSWAAQRAGFKQVGQWQDNKVTLTRG